MLRRHLQFESLEERRLLAADLWIEPQILAAVGAPVEAPVEVRDAENVVSIDVTLVYDSARLSFQSVEVGDLLAGLGAWAANLQVNHDEQNAEVRLTTFDIVPFSAAVGELFLFEFLPVADTHGEAILDLVAENGETQFNEGSAPLTVSDGSVLVRDQDTALLSISQELQGEAGDSVFVPVDISDASALLAADLEITYDETLLSIDADGVFLTEGQRDSITGQSGWTLNANVTQAGLIRVAMFDTEELSGSGVFLWLEFTIDGAAAEGDSTVIDIVVPPTELNEGSAHVVARDGRVGVIETAFPWHNASSPFDVNKDGRVNLLDAFIVIDALRNRGVGAVLPPEGPGPGEHCVDVNQNNKIDLVDAFLVIDRIRQLRGGEGEGQTPFPLREDDDILRS